jgi:hypothetical protein
MSYPKPPDDSGMGLHGGANAFYPLGENGPAWAIGQLKEMGFSWVKLLDVEGSSLDCVRACKAAGIEPIIRLYRPVPQPGTLDEAPKTKAAVPLLIAAGAHYFEVSNEDNVFWEQKSGTIPADAPEQSARGFMVDADYIIGLGGIPLITAMSPGGHRDDIEYLQKMVWWLKDHWGLARIALCAIACHNAALNHPLNYPFDAINQSAENKGQQLLDPGASNGWLKYRAVHDLVLRETGLSLPVLSTEGGIWPGEHQDARYPAVTPQAVTDGYMQIRREMREGKYPDWYFTTGFWLMANRGMGNPAMEFEYQTWFNSNGVWIDSVAAYKADGPFVRPASVPDVPPVVPPPTAGMLLDEQIADVCRQAGFWGKGLTTAVAVALAESGGNPAAVNTTGNFPEASRDRGLFQINSFWHPEVTDAEAFDPLLNAHAAYTISTGGMDWDAWSSYTQGTYMAYWDRACAVTNPRPDPEALKNAAWGAMGVNYYPDAALAKYAAEHGIGVPLCNEFRFTSDCGWYVGQVYIGDFGPQLVYCKDGQWDQVHQQEL